MGAGSDTPMPQAEPKEAAPATAAEIMAAIRQANDISPPEPVEVPEWGGVTVYVRQLSAAEKDAHQTRLMAADGSGINLANAEEQRVRLVALCMVDSNGIRVIPKLTPKALVELGEKSEAAIQRINKVAQRLNKLELDEADKKGKE